MLDDFGQYEPREPLLFAIGDTLAWCRFLPDYQPVNGWSLFYEIRGGAAGDANIQFAATVPANSSNFQVQVLPAVTAAWLAGDYVLVGYVTGVENGVAARHQVYYGPLTLTPNLGDSGSDAPTTHEQRMIPLLETALEQLAVHVLQETDIEKTRLMRVKREELTKQLAWNRTVRANQIAQENVRNGKRSGRTITPKFLGFMLSTIR